MPCPTCSHTLHPMNDARSCWCPRCGTVKHGEEVFVPKLVERCRVLETHTKEDVGVHPGAAALLGILNALGISEAINLPEGRPT